MRPHAHLLGSAALALGFTTAVASAQNSTCVFTINQGASAFTWSGSAAGFPVTGNPSTSFNLSGTVDFNLATEPGQFSTGQLVGGDALVVPDIHGHVVVLFAEVATIDITGLRLSPRSPAFTPSPGPTQWSAPVVMDVIAGQAEVFLDPVLFGGTGTPTITDLAGTSSTPQGLSGQIVNSGSQWELLMPVNLSFAIEVPGSTITGSLNLNGAIIGTAPLGCRASLFTDADAISIAAGGAQNMIIDAGPSNGNDVYWMFGTASGTSPGLPGPPPLALNFDDYTLFLLVHPNSVVANSLGLLDPLGGGTATLPIGAAALDPSLAGLTLHHAHVVFDGTQTKWWNFPKETSNPMPLVFTP